VFRKPDYFLMDEPTKRIIIVGPDKDEANIVRGLLGLSLTASIYCGTTQYRLHQLTGWTRHDAHTLMAEMENK
jgi:hypothetical protein